MYGIFKFKDEKRPFTPRERPGKNRELSKEDFWLNTHTQTRTGGLVYLF